GSELRGISALGRLASGDERGLRYRLFDDQGDAELERHEGRYNQHNQHHNQFNRRDAAALVAASARHAVILLGLGWRDARTMPKSQLGKSSAFEGSEVCGMLNFRDMMWRHPNIRPRQSTAVEAACGLHFGTVGLSRTQELRYVVDRSSTAAMPRRQAAPRQPGG